MIGWNGILKLSVLLNYERLPLKKRTFILLFEKLENHKLVQKTAIAVFFLFQVNRKLLNKLSVLLKFNCNKNNIII